MMSTFRSKH